MKKVKQNVKDFEIADDILNVTLQTKEKDGDDMTLSDKTEKRTEAEFPEKTEVPKDEEAFEDIVKRYTPTVKAAIRTRLRSSEDIEDCTSEVFSELWQSREKLDSSNLPALLCVMAKRRAVDHYRRNSRKATEPLDESENSMSDGFSLEGDFELRETREEMIKAIKALGTPDSVLIIGRYYFGEDSKTLGQKYGLSTNAVDLRIHRAVKKLRRQFNKGGENN